MRTLDLTIHRLWTFLFLCVLISPSYSLQSQNLLSSRSSSYHSYLYRLTEEEAKTVYTDGIEVLDENYLHTLLDSSLTDSSYQQVLQLGHYLFVHTEANELVFELHSVGKLQYQIIDNQRDLLLVVHDSLGTMISDAVVRVKNKQILYDSQLQAYRLPKGRKEGLVQIVHQGHSDYYLLDAQNGPITFTRVMRRIAFTIPIRWLWRPAYGFVRSIGGTIKHGSPQGWIYRITKPFRYYYWENWWTNHMNRKYGQTSYLVTNQPMYRPRDTVKLKAFVMTRKGRGLNRKLPLRLKGYSGNRRISKQLTKLSPYRSGGYTYEFVLDDSLNLQLDKDYSLSLEGKFEYDLVETRFKLEDYELKQSKYEARRSLETHQRGQAQQIYVQITDANDLNLPGSQVELLVSPKSVKNWHGDQVFLPDTIWHHTQALDPVGETTITIPDSLLPTCSFDYDITVILMTAERERKVISLKASFEDVNEALELHYVGDSLTGSYLLNQAFQAQKVKLTAYSADGGRLYTDSIALPAVFVNNPIVARYELNHGMLYANAAGESLVQVLSDRTADSLHLILDNPRKLPVWYHLYYQNQELQRGKANQLDLKLKTLSPKPYFLSISYLWQGKMHKKEFQMPFHNRQINLSVKHPVRVYPGQEVEIDIQAQTAAGRAIADLDVLAYGLTNQFEDYQAPRLGDLSRVYKGRKFYNQFSNTDLSLSAHKQELDYHAWNQGHRLDSIALYQFLYPDSGLYRYEVDIPERRSTEFAPFVVDEKGQLDPVQIIYVDRLPVFFRGAKGWERYSIPVKRGYHSVQLRTRTRRIELDSLYIPSGKKLILSASTFRTHPQKRVIGVPEELTQQEIIHLQRFFFPMKQNRFPAYSYLKQGDRILLTNSHLGGYYLKYNDVFGPFYSDSLYYHSPGEFKTGVVFEPGFRYEFQKGVVKLWELPAYRRFSLSVLDGSQSVKNAQYGFPALAYTEAEILTAWEEANFQTYYAPIKYDMPSFTKSGYGELRITFDSIPNPAPKVMILVSPDSVGFFRNLPPTARKFHQLEPGRYDLLLFLSDQAYYHIDSLEVQANGINHVRIELDSLEIPDSLMLRLYQLASKRRVSKKEVRQDKADMRNLYQQKIAPRENQDGWETVYGKLTDGEGNALMGATIVVKGTAIGTITDLDGEFYIQAPNDAVLICSFIGYQTEELVLQGDRYVQVEMKSRLASLDEVVVVGVANDPSRMAIGYATTMSTTLTGKVAGMRVQSDKAISIRGAASINESEALIVIDGVPVQMSFADLDPASITSIQTMVGTEASAIYGSRGSNGVILIETSSGAQIPAAIAEDTGEAFSLPAEASSLRSNFRDYAFWEPRLKTDKQGKARFTARIPDDITQWKTFALAIGKGKYIGQTQSAMQAYKPVQARLSLPRFMVEGDSTYVIGKVQNYLADTVHLMREFAIESDTLFQRPTPLVASLLDTIAMVAPQTDSVTLTYRIEDKKGYEDGERRSIQIFPRGSRETEGRFLYLATDTSLQLTLDPNKGPVRIHAESSRLDQLRTEIDFLHNYPYACNEQAASKLKGLLWEQQVSEQLSKPFSHRKTIQKLIRRLIQAQRVDGYWGWWKNGKGEIWITQHVVEALLLAKEMDYTAPFQKAALMDALAFEAQKKVSRKHPQTLMLLKQLDSSHNAMRTLRVLGELDHDSLAFSSQSLELLQLRQAYQLSIQLDSLWHHREETLRENWYWKGSGRFGFHHNDLLTTLRAYEILREAGVGQDTLMRIQNYFLEHRAQYNYWNTYQTAEVLAGILPDVLKESKDIQPVELQMTGGFETDIQTFPLDTVIEASEALRLSKTGTGPLYLSISQTWHNTDPKPVGDDFRVRTWLGTKDDSLSVLKGGIPVSLHAELILEKDADYVMLELPIPAGCSYEDKSQSYRYGEVHREYRREKTAIFCQHLKAGTYHFEVKLLPRYSGKYTLNPGRVEEMYFPVFYGRGAMQTIEVE